MIKRLINKRFEISLLLILLLAIFLRFVNYSNRWGLAYDQAHDALLARYAISGFHIPLVGPFASGAQFQTSGIWYWFLMVATQIYSPLLIMPWLVITSSYVLFVVLMILIGRELEGKYFGLLVGILTAVSTAQIAQSTNLTLTAPMCFISALAILAFLKYAKTKKKIYLFLLGLSFGLAPSTHLQGVLLIVAFPVFIIALKLKDIKSWAILILGLVIPIVPLIIFDLRNNLVNSVGLINYLFHSQYRTSYDALGRRWLTYIAIFWPSPWALIIGGYSAVSYLIGVIFSGLIIEKIYRKGMGKTWITLIISFILMVIVMRYVRNPLFESYLVILHPFVLLFSALAIFLLSKKNLYLGLALLVLIIAGSIYKDYLNIASSTNTAAIVANDLSSSLIQKYPSGKFSVYDYNYKSSGFSFPLILYLDGYGKINDNGIKIGIVNATSGALIQFKEFPIISNGNNYQIININSSNSSELKKQGWIPVNPSYIYNSVEDWHKNK
jgi:hypothetical protein